MRDLVFKKKRELEVALKEWLPKVVLWPNMHEHVCTHMYTCTPKKEEEEKGKEGGSKEGTEKEEGRRRYF